MIPDGGTVCTANKPAHIKTIAITTDMNLTTRLMLAATLIMPMISCSSKGVQAEVREEAAQIEAAHIDGRETARAFVSRHYKDSLELQHQLVEAGARRSKYDSLPQSLAAFDSAFISTVRTVRPEIAAELQRARPAATEAMRRMKDNR